MPGSVSPVDVQLTFAAMSPGRGGRHELTTKSKDQLFASYATGREVRELAVVLGEASLDDTDRAHLKFADAFEREFVGQGEFENRTVEESLDIGWKLLAMLPQTSLKRVKPAEIDEYLPTTTPAVTKQG
jgi:Archaeal/vacuolar-type H+-ATPase subunit B